MDRGDAGKGKSSIVKSAQNFPKLLSEISLVQVPRIPTRFREFDNVLGGGIVAGSIILLGGEPGIGKSTLLLQMALQITDKKILYISGEESESQLKMRAERLFPKHQPDNFLILTETDTNQIFEHVKSVKPDLLIIDSIQTLQSQLIDSAAGSISQIRECAAEFQHFAKSTGTPVFLIGHITKDGSLAGPKILEHIVDTVLQFEGDIHYGYRIVRCIKNRFGSTSELGIFEMQGNGLREVLNPHPCHDHRDTGAGEQRGVWHPATCRHRLRHPPAQHAAGRLGETVPLQTRGEGCVHQHRRRHPC